MLICVGILRFGRFLIVLVKDMVSWILDCCFGICFVNKWVLCVLVSKSIWGVLIVKFVFFDDFILLVDNENFDGYWSIV